MKTLKESLTEQIESMSNDELVTVHNIYCEGNNDMDSAIYVNDDDFLNENFSTAAEAVRAATYGEYKFSDKYVRFDGYANLESFDDVEANISIDEIVEHAMENESDYSMLDFDIEEEEEEETED